VAFTTGGQAPRATKARGHDNFDKSSHNVSTKRQNSRRRNREVADAAHMPSRHPIHETALRRAGGSGGLPPLRVRGEPLTLAP
jgi:hypothetical protein